MEKVIVGGIDEEGNKDPAQLTFVYKTGLKNSVDGDKFKPQRKNARGRHRTDKLCSNASNEIENMCSDCSDDTCGSRMLSTKGEYVEILEFTYFARVFKFSGQRNFG